MDVPCSRARGERRHGPGCRGILFALRCAKCAVRGGRGKNKQGAGERARSVGLTEQPAVTSVTPPDWNQLQCWGRPTSWGLIFGSWSAPCWCFSSKVLDKIGLFPVNFGPAAAFSAPKTSKMLQNGSIFKPVNKRKNI